jgi:gamma-glutamyl phosphate reductase
MLLQSIWTITEWDTELLENQRKSRFNFPRGGENLINFVKKHATCPVIVSGRGNNFVYVNKEADLDKALAYHQSMAKRQIFRFVPWIKFD